MGSLSGNANAIAAFTGQPYPNGLDLARCVINNELGIWSADPAATFLQGMMVGKGTNGIVDIGNAAQSAVTNTNVLGIAKWNKALTLYAVQVDEPMTFTGAASTATTKYPNITHFSIRTVAGVGGTSAALCTETTDYTGPTSGASTSGVITAVISAKLVATNPQTAYATYMYPLTPSQLDLQGRNFWNFTDDVSIQASAITVITAPAIIFTTQYDTSVSYAVTGSLSNLYPTSAGLFSSTSSGSMVGKVIQVPTATDPYLGLSYFGPVTASS